MSKNGSGDSENLCLLNEVLCSKRFRSKPRPLTPLDNHYGRLLGMFAHKQ